MNPLQAALKQHREQGTFRSLSLSQNRLDFASNDYLGLAQNQEIRAALIEHLKNGCPLGATGSRLISGHTPDHVRVEGFLAKAFGAPSALLFSSGYLANLAVLGTFGSLEAEFFCDELNHASLIDGIRLSQSPKVIFRHNDMNSLEQKLRQSSAPLKVIVSESVFSMEGTLAPLPALLELACRFDAWLVLDEAHATGVFGAHGLGRLDGTAHDARVIAIHTGGKALGAQGAFVLMDTDFRDLLINRARSFMFTTALAPLCALQLELAVRAVMNDPSKGRGLLHAAEDFRHRLAQMGFNTAESRSQIVPIVLGSNARVCSEAARLQQMGFDIRAIRSPTVREGTERLRLTLKSFHSTADRLALVAAVQK